MISIHALLAESDSDASSELRRQPAFLSTLSLRRATIQKIENDEVQTISIHALLAESDYGDNKKIKVVRIFLSTLSLRRATLD